MHSITLATGCVAAPHSTMEFFIVLPMDIGIAMICCCAMYASVVANLTIMGLQAATVLAAVPGLVVVVAVYSRVEIMAVLE